MLCGLTRLEAERGHIGSRLGSVTLYDRVNAETRQGLPTAVEEYPFLRGTLTSEVAQLLHGVRP